ncbi:hypothetical protein [Oscillibacter sp.]|uniref:hypothetical protein n=1 Tax=Oscillibacter sp. TaxID=1945593 RepID=UPI0037CAD773
MITKVKDLISIEKEQYSSSLMLAYRMPKVFETTVEDLCCLQVNKEWRMNSVKIYHKKKRNYFK